MMTTERVGFTKNQEGHVAPCYGVHHKDVAVLGHCDGCGMEVAKSDDGRIMTVYYRGDWFARKVACWAPNHECDPAQAASHQAKVVAEIEAGEIIKGQTVEVVRGRKVPKGTAGEIVWVGVDSFGKARVGIKTADGETVFTAQSNVEVQA